MGQSQRLNNHEIDINKNGVIVTNADNNNAEFPRSESRTALLGRSFSGDELNTISPSPSMVSMSEISVVGTEDTEDTEVITPLPRIKLFAIFIIILCDGITTYSIFPYINFMVKDFGLTKDEEKLGYYVGVLASAFYISQFFSSFFWGWLSNIKGRRPALLIGLIGTMVTSVMFGMSTQYWIAIVFRFLSGLVNGNVGVSKTMVGEITDSSNQARAFTIMGISWGCGAIVAPLIGGLFSNVCIVYPGVVHSGLLCKFPYLLPNLICVALNLVGWILCYIYLPESKSFEIKYSSIKRKEKKKTSTIKGIQNSLRNLLKRNKSYEKQIDQVDQDLEMSVTKNRSGHAAIASSMKGNQSIGDFGDLEAERAGGDESNQDDFQEVSIENYDDDCEDNPRSLRMLFKDRPIMFSCMAYALMGFVFTIFEEVFPVWSPISKELDSNGNIVGGGGLGFNSKEIGIIQSSAGIFALLIQLLIFAPMAKRFGLITCLKVAIIAAVPSWIFLPELTRLVGTHVDASGGVMSDHNTWFWVLMFPSYLFQSFSNEVGFIAVIVIVSNSALPKDMALVNSISQSLVAIGRAIGPLLGTSILSLSLSHHLPYPLDRHLIFVILLIFTLTLFGLTFLLPKSLNYTKEKHLIELKKTNKAQAIAH
eukprot:gene12364-14504_t